MSAHFTGQRAAVIGGSIGGLTTALLLQRLGFEVTVYERNASELDGKGGGIVLQPEMLRWFCTHSHHAPEKVSVSTEYLRFLGEDNAVVYQEEIHWSYSSWSTLYKALLSDLGRDNCVFGEYAVGYTEQDAKVEVRFASGRREEAELLVFADGISSTGRDRLNGGHVPSEYAGYVGWRGTVGEFSVSDETRALLADALSYSLADNTHICMYPIPGPTPDERLLNYVWYRNVPAGPELDEMLVTTSGWRGTVSVPQGQVQQRFIDDMREGAGVLAPAAAELVRKTAEPYIQRIVDIRSPRMASRRVAVLGDAAFAARPHGAAGTAKAADEAWALAQHLEQQGDIPAALASWEPERLEIANRLVDRVAEMGRVAQFANAWTPGDPAMRFGLRGPREV